MLNFNELKSQRGVAAVEFAIVLPILVILLAGIIEFSLLLYNQQVITNASREGARAAINPIPKIEDKADITSIVEDYCFQRMITFGSITNPLEVDVIGLNGASGSDMIVIVKYEYGFLIPGFFNLGSSYPLETRTVMRLL